MTWNHKIRSALKIKVYTFFPSQLGHNYMDGELKNNDTETEEGKKLDTD